ncbi:MAG TPA: di-heme oxidoredictase family protein [Kofleriaceae bacterium]|nr:di-heme oxidoredictase family protein [Kofleriaceae bacterium]
MSAGISAGCASEPADEEVVAFTATEQAVTAVAGDPLPGTDPAAFDEAKTAFSTVEGIEDGVGPVFNERGCGVCHSLGAVGGAGVQIERRFGRFDNGIFSSLSNKGGSLRQLFTVGSFTGLNGQSCNVPVEVEPPEATVHNVGRLTTPLFGAGLVESIPDSVIAANATVQSSAVRGIVSRVKVLLPNPKDPNQTVGSTRVGRFGWKAGIATLAQFAADAYMNEMGITTQHCIAGQSILTFANESRPNGVAVPAGCDDLVPSHGIPGIPDETDDVVGVCASGQTELQDDVGLFTDFMTFLAPAPRLPIDPNINLQGGTVFNRIGCAQCHLLKDYTTPSHPANGVPGNFTFRPRSDFLLHDIGTGDFIGNDGDSVATTRLIRTAPLWGLHHRTSFLHDGSASSIEQAIARHGGQAAASRSAFNALGTSDRNAMLAAMKSD